MCGICGFIGKNIRAQEITKKMVHRLHHRGPDSVGLYQDQVGDKYIALGHARLKIIRLE